MDLKGDEIIEQIDYKYNNYTNSMNQINSELVTRYRMKLFSNYNSKNHEFYASAHFYEKCVTFYQTLAVIHFLNLKLFQN